MILAFGQSHSSFYSLITLEHIPTYLSQFCLDFLGVSFEVVLISIVVLTVSFIFLEDLLMSNNLHNTPFSQYIRRNLIKI